MFNIDDIHSKLLSGEEFSIEFSFIGDEINQEIYSLLQKIMSSFDTLFLLEVVYSVLKEILINAGKAIAKRDYFVRNNLNIEDPIQYKKGMESFLHEVTEQWKEQEQFLKKSSYKVTLKGKIENQILVFKVQNNSPILPEEMRRIEARIEASKKYKDLSDAFLEMSDTQESAGLGIILIQLLLRNTGIGSDKLSIKSESGITTVTLSIPKEIVSTSITNRFKTKIMGEIEGIPPLPQSLTKLVQMCNNPDSNINIIASEIEKNPSLSADLLKLSNSNFFSNRNKVSTILAAVKVVGLKNVRNMLYVSGVRKIMDGRYEKLQKVWEHSNRCSYFARLISMDYGKGKYADLVAVGGVLHDIGKLVLLTIDRSLSNRLNAYKDKEQSNSTIIEEISIGISHSTIGALLSKKWGFPDDLVAVIEFHHRPFMAPPQHKDVVEIIYLANMLSDVADNKANFFSIDSSILKTFSLNSQEQFEKYLKKVTTLYDSQAEQVNL